MEKKTRRNMMPVAFGVVALIVFSGGVFSFYNLHQISKNYEKVLYVGKQNDIMIMLQTSSKNAIQSALAMQYSSVSKKDLNEIRNNFKKAVQAFNSAAKMYETGASEAEKSLLGNINSAWSELRSAVEQMVDLAAESQTMDTFLKIYNGEFQESSHKLEKALVDLMDFEGDETDRWNVKVEKSIKFGSWINAIIPLFCCIVVIVLGIFFSKQLSRNMQKLLMPLSLELEKITGQTAQLDEESEHLRNSAAEISSASENLAQASTEQSSALQETASSIEQMSVMIKMNADNASNSTTIATSSLDVALQGQKAITQLGQAMNEVDRSNTSILKQVLEGNRQITEIVRVIHEIGEKTKVIDDIVFQTRLLSFNASVEAARAGEHGKGFAVVAEEVGSLAQMSGKAAKEISEMLHGSIQKVERIVTETKQKVERLISESSTKVDTGGKLARQCGEILTSIVKNAEDMSRLVVEIASASKEQAVGVAEITKAMGQLDQITHENAATSQKTSESSEALLGQAGGLLKIVDRLQQAVKQGGESYGTVSVYIGLGDEKKGKKVGKKADVVDAPVEDMAA